MPGQVPAAVVQERYERLAALIEEITWEGNRGLLGRELEVLAAEGEGRKDVATRRMSGRARDGRLVHFKPGEIPPRPGDMATVGVTHAAPHHLIADLPPVAVRRTRGGDAWQAARGETGPAGSAVLLGMPSVGRPSDQ
jgi:tRNA-2-methylthio-N6-dimethylallyladenosine synthase